jgi:hypothetical protein
MIEIEIETRISDGSKNRDPENDNGSDDRNNSPDADIAHRVRFLWSGLSVNVSRVARASVFGHTSTPVGIHFGLSVAVVPFHLLDQIRS